ILLLQSKGRKEVSIARKRCEVGGVLHDRRRYLAPHPADASVVAALCHPEWMGLHDDVKLVWSLLIIFVSAAAANAADVDSSFDHAATHGCDRFFTADRFHVMSQHFIETRKCSGVLDRLSVSDC